jgi:ribosomal protein S18 acetylase RimI-like enzyme
VPETDLNRQRARFGMSAELWAGTGAVEIRPDGWLALSRVDAVDYNVAAAYGSGERLEELLGAVSAADVPAVVMVAGAALGEVQHLIDAGWVCIGSRAFMRLALGGDDQVTGAATVRRLGSDELEAVRALVGEVYDLPRELTGVAIPEGAVNDPDRTLWGVHDDNGMLMACLAAVRIEDTLAIWSMATAPAERRRGFGRDLVQAVLSDAGAQGATECLLHSSGDGEPLYYELGFEQLERWQMWSRPRWVLGRA